MHIIKNEKPAHKNSDPVPSIPDDLIALRSEWLDTLSDDGLSAKRRISSAAKWYGSFEPAHDMEPEFETLLLVAEVSEAHCQQELRPDPKFIRTCGDSWLELARITDDPQMRTYSIVKSRAAYQRIANDSAKRAAENKDILEILVNSQVQTQNAYAQLATLDLMEIKSDHDENHITDQKMQSKILIALEKDRKDIEDFADYCRVVYERCTIRSKASDDPDNRYNSLGSELAGILWERVYANTLRRIFMNDKRDDLVFKISPSIERQDMVYPGINTPQTNLRVKGFDIVVPEYNGTLHRVQLKKRPRPTDKDYTQANVDIIYAPPHGDTPALFDFATLCLGPLPRPGTAGYKGISAIFIPEFAIKRSDEMLKSHLRRIGSTTLSEDMMDATKRVVGQ